MAMLGKEQVEKTQYKCVRCGNCCRWPGYVHLEDDEIDSIAEQLGMERQDFVDRYTRLPPSRKNLALTEQPGGACVFLADDNLCSIQPVKPRQCRRFPNEWNFPNFRRRCNAVPTE